MSYIIGALVGALITAIAYGEDKQKETLPVDIDLSIRQMHENTHNDLFHLAEGTLSSSSTFDSSFKGFDLVFMNFGKRFVVDNILLHFTKLIEEKDSQQLEQKLSRDEKTFEVILESLGECRYKVLYSSIDTCLSTCSMKFFTDYQKKIPIYVHQNPRLVNDQKSMLIEYIYELDGVRILAFYHPKCKKNE